MKLHAITEGIIADGQRAVGCTQGALLQAKEKPFEPGSGEKKILTSAYGSQHRCEGIYSERKGLLDNCI